MRLNSSEKMSLIAAPPGVSGAPRSTAAG